ncbi:MAG: hypothetical protein KF744_01855 [Taibaiella sp.]|nr:hypothetical protein [Taibaiella sp.]
MCEYRLPLEKVTICHYSSSKITSISFITPKPLSAVRIGTDRETAVAAIIASGNFRDYFYRSSIVNSVISCVCAACTHVASILLISVSCAFVIPFLLNNSISVT